MNAVCKRADGFMGSSDPQSRASWRSCVRSYHGQAGAREAPTAGFDALESAAEGSESAASVHRLEYGASFGRSALRKHIFDEGPARAGRAYIGAAFEPAAQPRKASAHHIDPGEWLAVEWRVAFGAKRR